MIHKGLKVIIGLSLLLTHSAMIAAPNQQVKIVSDSAKFEQATGQATYHGKVKLTDSQNILLADKLIVYKNKQGQLVKVIATGKPAKFTGKMPDTETVTAKAEQITLYPDNSLLKLVGNANIHYKNDSFNGPLLEYHYKDHVIVANKMNDNRPSITLETPKIKKYGS